MGLGPPRAKVDDRESVGQIPEGDEGRAHPGLYFPFVSFLCLYDIFSFCPADHGDEEIELPQYDPWWLG